MRTKIDFRLCDTSFWDNNSTWYAQKPTFSYCFMDTALVWLPACFLLFAVINEFMNCREAKVRGLKPIPLNLFNRSRLFVTFLLLVLSLSETFYNIYTLIRGLTGHRPESSVEESVFRVVSISTLIAPIIKLSSYLVLLVIYFKQRRAGLHTSASIWFYLLISVICDALSFYTVIVIFKKEQDFDIVKLVVELIHFPLMMLLFILECRGDTLIVDPDLTDIRPDSPELQASFCSSIVFWWFNGFLLFGYRSRLKLTNLWKTLSRDKASGLAAVFRGTWARPTKSSKKTAYQAASGNVQQTNNIIFVLAKLFSPKLFSAASLKFLQDILQYVTPLLLKRLLYYMSSKNEPEWHGTLFAISLLVVPTLQSLILGTYFYKMQLIGLQIRTMIIGSIYRKALLLSGSSRMQSTSGEIVNLMAVDTQRFQDVLLYVNLIWSAPFQIILAVILLYRELGWSVFAGVGCMALMLPANAFLANRIKFSQIKLMKTKDERIKQMNELLGGIRVIKLYAWENSFISNLLGFRNRELEHLKHILTLDAVQTFLWQCSPFVVSLVTFAVYVHVDPANVLNAQKAFVSISLFNLLRFPLTMLPSLVTSLVLTIVSARRLNKFLNNDELVKYVTRNEELEAIAIEGGTLSWSQDKEGHSPERAVLKDIDLHIKPNTFVAILGQVASGKSSLLAAILGEMHRIAGRFNILESMKVAYVPQQAWIQNMSLKENILFGSPFNEEKYKQVLSVCSLESDLATLPGGDQAEIGEKGINLSGGQKQRVSLARACYSESDIFLLDDPLSALDSHVAKHVFDKVLSSSSGILKDKTRVLATNSLFVLPYVDQIVFLDEGRIVESGTYKELMAKDKGYLTEMMRQYSGKDEELEMQKTDASDENEEPTRSPEIVPGNEGILTSETQAIGADIGKLIEVEKVETGSVGYTVYLAYFKAVSILWLLAVFISLVSSASFNVATNIWLSMWSSDAEKDELSTDDHLKTLRLIVYAILGGLQCLSVLLGSLALSRGAVRAAHHLHSSLLERVMHSPMVFFDTTPIGRIVNRFAKDIDVVDSTLPGTSRSWLNCFLQVASTMFVICYSFPSFLIIIIPLGIIYYLIQKIFIVTTRQLKRLESTTRSPIYSHFSETLSGINTIRAYNSADRFISLSDNLVDRNQSCSYPNIIANRWLSVRLEFFGNLITACAALFSVYNKSVVGAEVAGLTISYSLSITQTLSWLVRMTSDLETHIVSVERILEYMLNKQEDCWIKSERPSPDWPNKGAIQIEDYSTRYRDETDLVLRNINIDIKPREKIGIVGRTGSGKSSLSLSLFRILEPASGRIMIDQLDIVKYGLHDIRSKLTIIPQDPVLFSGTLRFNLDPLQLYSDMEIWRALELAHLRTYMSSLESGLDYKVIEYGENFSVGQRQLICLARAILRKSKILILDEATASVDLETDSIVQKTIRDIFDDCTIITIAHRLHTILDSDRILVLDKGHVKELDSPESLIINPESAFSSLVKDAGIDSANVLKLAATRRKQD